MRWSDKQPPTFDHRLVSWIHFNAPRRTAFLVLFYELSIAGDVAVKMEEINFFRFAVIRGKNPGSGSVRNRIRFYPFGICCSFGHWDN